MTTIKKRFLSVFIVLASMSASALFADPMLTFDRTLSVPGTQAFGNNTTTPSNTNKPNLKQKSAAQPIQNNQVINSQSTSSQLGLATNNEPNLAIPQVNDYIYNLNSEVFGANLFTGAFAKQGAQQFNPDYVVVVGDQVQVKLWGAFDFDEQLTVDPKGNVFLPFVGPVRLQGLRNQDLQAQIAAAVSKQFKANVNSYASLSAAQPVRIYVGGFVNRPGLYNGTSMDSLLHFLDQAGGIDVQRGSFLNVQVKRGKQTRSTVNLYNFLLNGEMPIVQLSDGDVIFVSPRQNIVLVNGIVDNAKLFEFDDTSRTVSDLMKIAKPQPSATHVRVIRNSGTIKNVEYFPLSESSDVGLQSGDAIEFTADKRPGTITVRVQGEHQSQQEYVLPYGSKFKDILPKIEFSARSESESIQLFRTSVKARQKQQLEISLRTLEATILTARSETDGEAAIRKADAELLTQWITLAKDIQPLGQVAITNGADMNELLLENGDVINVPTKDSLVLIGGEVLFPNAIAYNEADTLNDYINKAGGYTQNADLSRVIVVKRNGTYAEAKNLTGIRSYFSPSTQVVAGDQVLILPKVDIKSRQIIKEVAQIVGQLAITARIVFGL
jgi:protein involved in polysaccharide export with SLBB domain